MSSTKRGATRVVNDFYPTPAWCVHRLLDRICGQLPWDGVWLEPCVGAGAIVDAVASWQIEACARAVGGSYWPPHTMAAPEWQLVDIAPQYAREGVTTADYLTTRFTQRAAVAITNPPFSFAMEFVEAMRNDAQNVIVLQKLNWLGSESRSAFWREAMPDVYVLPNRPSFGLNAQGKPGTDSVDYAWFVWPLHTSGRGFIEVLDDTPLVERR